MPSKFEIFNDLHESGELFVLPNVWNVKSALFFQENRTSCHRYVQRSGGK